MKLGRAGRAVRALGAVLLSACAPDTLRPWHDEPGFRWREIEIAAGDARGGFTRLTGRSGIRFQNEVSDSALLHNRVLSQGAGVAIGDVDGDGRADVFLGRTSGCSALFRNLGGWRFEEIAQRAGVGACGRHTTGVAFADIDGDSDLDLLLLATTGPNAVFVNDGTGHFAERRDLGLDSAGHGGTTLAMADVDGDARLDLYVATYKAYNLDDSIPPQQRAFNQMVRQVGSNRYEVTPEFRDYYKLVLRHDMGGLRLSARGDPDQFYINRGGLFERVALTSGRFRDAGGKRLTEEPESWGLGAKFADLNGDGAPDLYVANDFEDTDQLWFNDGRGNFRLAPWTAQRQASNSAMGVDVADVNGDGLPDLFVVDMLSDDTHRLKTEIPTHTAFPKRPGDVTMPLQQQRNTLFVNRGDGTFTEVSAFAGVQASGWSWSTMFLDVDLDGWQDILVANGHLWDIMDADAQEGLQNRLNDVNWRRQRWEFPPLRLKNVAYRNRGDLTFEDVSERWRFGVEADISHAMAAGDLDGDGDLDVIVNRLGSPALVLRNDATAPRIAVRLKGDAPNTFAVGAKIRLHGRAVPVQEREVVVGGLYMSHSDYEASFAMGASDSATLVVEWRDGRVTTIHNVRPNRLYEVTTTTAVARAEARPAAAPATLFQDASAELAGHSHVEPPYDDWERQFLLPNALSQLGPGVSWFDFDRDGDEDLFVGAGRGGRLGVFRNEGGRLVAQPGQGPAAPADLTTILGLPAASGVRLLVGVSNWEQPRPARGPPPPWAIPGVVGVATTARGISTGTESVALPQESATGPMALGDYDGDGDLDLFVGGRAISGAYPRRASSRLYRNAGGRFLPDSGNGGILEGVGLVSAALFADIDSDGDPDLILAREWDSLLLLINRGGRFSLAPDSWGLHRWTSRWNGLATGDLDGDGRLDLVATSWGRNVMTPTDSARPLLMFHGPIGAAGEEEMLLGRYDPRLRDVAPLNSFARVRVAIPDVTKRTSTFAAYADASVEQVLGPAMLRVQRVTAATLDHMAFFNRGDHFDPVALPPESQLSPAFFAGVADFDGDGAEDVFLSQNFYPTALGLPRYDQGRGLLLLGNGKGGLRPMPGDRSGILVYGDQRGAAYSDIDADGRLDVVISQNGAATRLYHNRGARPGLRVRVRGPASNPDGVGTQLRVDYGDHLGPVREIQAGSGYWSQNGAVQVFGLSAAASAVWVRWPGGKETRTTLPAGAREVTVRP